MNKRFLICFTQILLSISLYSQIAPYTYWVSFTDKKESPYSIENPEEFLSERSIDRRNRQNINITETDLPVNKTYLDSLQSIGLVIHNVSKWLNGAAIISTDTALLDTLHNISFIKEPVQHKSASSTKNAAIKFTPLDFQETNYVYSQNQLDMLYLSDLHKQNTKGQGMLIGILDAGFTNSWKIESLKHLWERDKIIASRDFVKDSKNLFYAHLHGTLVLSIIAADWQDTFYGSAPEADFVLIRTENGDIEYLVEEYNWISGAEYADSIGVDIINSSLGYSEFDDESQNHTYSDLDGKTIPITIGATMAARTGMLIVNSAGNSGDNPWRHITAPGDADSILTIGAVDSLELIADFSSRGPTADERIKPDVCAVGSGTAGQVSVGSLMRCQGTSCSAPLITGLAACLWQKYPNATNQQLRQAILESSHLYTLPDNDYGYGIPNALVANSHLATENDTISQLTNSRLYPNPTNNSLSLKLQLPWLDKTVEGTSTILDINGRTLSTTKTIFIPGFNIFEIQETKLLEAGYYYIQVNVYNRIYSFPFIKLN